MERVATARNGVEILPILFRKSVKIFERHFSNLPMNKSTRSFDEWQIRAHWWKKLAAVLQTMRIFSLGESR